MLLAERAGGWSAARDVDVDAELSLRDDLGAQTARAVRASARPCSLVWY